MPTSYEVPVDATDWIAAVEQAAAGCHPGDTLIVHSFAQEKLAEQVLQRLGLAGEVTLVSTGKRMRFLIADPSDLSPREMAQRIFNQLKDQQARAARSKPQASSDEEPSETE